MAEFYSDSFKLGILGGGQLGRMFIQDAINFHVNVYILEQGLNSPASASAYHFTDGDIKDYETVYNFGKDKDVITIEIENVNIEALKKLESEGVKVFPQPHIVEMIQDKGAQKEFYSTHNIPTAPYYLINNRNEISSYITELPFAQKLRKGGYDGKGVTILKDEGDIQNGFDAPSLLETFVDFEKELSVIVARNEKGEIRSFPIAEQEFNPEANLVEFLFTPADVSTEVEQKAQTIAEDLVKKLDFVGLLAVELFLTKKGDLLVNEIAPRPHNSGHHTIEGNMTSQFEQHMRAILNLPLGSTEVIIPAVMINVLGEKGYTGKVKYEGMEEILAMPGVTPHIYGKSDTKPFRKMGHITVINKDINKAKRMAKEIKNIFKVISE